MDLTQLEFCQFDIELNYGSDHEVQNVAGTFELVFPQTRPQNSNLY
jgi:hypothetical protein